MPVNPTTVRGLKGTGDITQKRIVVDMDEEIAMLEPDSSLLLILLNKLGKDTVHNPEFDWQEDDYAPDSDTVNGATDLSTGATGTLPVNDAQVFRVDDLIVIPNVADQVCIVTAVDTGTGDIDIASLDGNNLGSYADADQIEIIGNANEEGSGKRVIISTQPSLPNNYTQIIKTPFGATKTLDATKIYGGNELDKDRKKAGIEHSLAIQRALIFGEKSKDTTGTHPKRTMGGIMSFITTNVKDMTGNPLTEDEWENYLELLFEYGNDTKYVFCSKKVISYISSFARDKVRIVPKDKTYGVAVTEYISPHGTVYLINARKIFRGDKWGNMAIGLDLPMIKYTILQGRDTKLFTNIQAPDEDQEIDQYLTECSVKLKVEEAHAVLENVG